MSWIPLLPYLGYGIFPCLFGMLAFCIRWHLSKRVTCFKRMLETFETDQLILQWQSWSWFSEYFLISDLTSDLALDVSISFTTWTLFWGSVQLCFHNQGSWASLQMAAETIYLDFLQIQKRNPIPTTTTHIHQSPTTLLLVITMKTQVPTWRTYVSFKMGSIHSTHSLWLELLQYGQYGRWWGPIHLRHPNTDWRTSCQV